MKYLTLDDVCLLNMGQSPDSSTYNEVGEGLPFIKVMQISVRDILSVGFGAQNQRK